MTLDSEESISQASTEPFGDLVRRHQGMVFSIACRFLGDRGHAEDVAQEVFFRLYGHRDSIQSPEHLVRWLRTVTARLCIDALRRRPPPANVPLDEVPSPAPDPADPLEQEHLRRLVGGLPAPARMAILLRYQEDLDPAEIAQILGEPLNTIKSRLQRALASLRDGFQRLAEGRSP